MRPQGPRGDFQAPGLRGSAGTSHPSLSLEWISTVSLAPPTCPHPEWPQRRLSGRALVAPTGGYARSERLHLGAVPSRRSRLAEATQSGRVASASLWRVEQNGGGRARVIRIAARNLVGARLHARGRSSRISNSGLVTTPLRTAIAAARLLALPTRRSAMPLDAGPAQHLIHRPAPGERLAVFLAFSSP